MAVTPQQIKKDLGKVLSGGAADVLTDIFTRIAFSTDSSIYQILPQCVVTPRTADDVAAVVRYAVSHGIPVVPRGRAAALPASR